MGETRDMSLSSMAVVLRLRCITLEVGELYIYTGEWRRVRGGENILLLPRDMFVFLMATVLSVKCVLLYSYK